jgi:hypothetical protein
LADAQTEWRFPFAHRLPAYLRRGKSIHNVWGESCTCGACGKCCAQQVEFVLADCGFRRDRTYFRCSSTALSSHAVRRFRSISSPSAVEEHQTVDWTHEWRSGPISGRMRQTSEMSSTREGVPQPAQVGKELGDWDAGKVAPRMGNG